MTRWLCVCVVLCVAWPGGRAEIVLGEETEDFDFDGLPGAQHEFKVEVAAGSEECYYQRIKQGGTLHVSFEVVQGGDNIISVFLRDPNFPSQPLDAIYFKYDGVLTYDATHNGSYAICLDNTHSRLHSKLVYVYYVTAVQEDWVKYHEELSNIQVTVESFRRSIQQVFESITAATMHQADMRGEVIRDYYLITRNNAYVQRWSIVQCVVIVGCSCVQVYFVRRLFRTPNVTSKSHKPRA